jgi:hypothetical protein
MEAGTQGKEPDVQHSAEARWFFTGTIPDPVEDWFLDGNASEPESRVDRYLVFPGCESVGVKLRDADDRGGGDFEIKVWVGAPQVTRFTPEVTARTDAWVKWSSPTPAPPRWVEPSFVTVAKERRQRTFSLDGGTGANAEVVTLEVDGRSWWTLGLESFGPREAVRPALLTVATHWFVHQPPCELGVIRSMSYPTWLAGLIP